MNRIFLILLTALSVIHCTSKPDLEEPVPDLYRQISDTNLFQFDSMMATALGADEYGMKSYVLAFLKSGPNRSQDSLTAARLQTAHLENISRMAREKKLVFAGPFLDDGEVRGIYIFNTESTAEAESWTNSDPAVQAGRLVMELHPFYGSAALGLIVPLSKRVTRTNIAD
ncbi:MAG TPA: YciI family protein [Saprospiraceae bacterium]|nr:hypothetical protein [Saprospiraceae bacterium]MCB9272261.1 hypothetical protein [Lewinellaceae bacterium]HPG07370.1 YciI family protein [Saprospiraceae bacterium]HPQ97998.1 YciI family protein [Saprospiraceae bacterium]HRV87301.1 YciI family protein [Saprospiraceae bacterium]